MHMIEPLFQPSSPLWPTLPSAGIGWPQGHPLQFAPRPAMPSAADVPGGITASTLLAAIAVRRGQPLGPTNDQETEDFIYDALELLSGATEVEVRCEGGRVTLTGNVLQKRVKRDVGEIAWSVPIVNDVQNNVTITARRRARGAGREGEPQSVAASRKQA